MSIEKEIVERLERLESDSHPPKETVPYETYCREISALQKRVSAIESSGKSTFEEWLLMEITKFQEMDKTKFGDGYLSALESCHRRLNSKP